MDESPTAGPPPDPPAVSTWPQAAAPPRRSSGKRPLAAVLVGGLIVGLAAGALALLVRGVWKRGAPRRADPEVAGAQNPAAGTSEAAGGAESPAGAAGAPVAAGAAGVPDGGNDADVDLVPDVDPALFRNRLEAASGGTKPVWQDGAPATLVDFWASWCGPCLQELPRLQELQERVEARGMRVVLINVDLGNATSTGRFLKRKGIRIDSLVDRDAILFQAIGLEALPSTFVLDAKGRPVEFIEGGASGEELETALARANEKRVRESYR